MRFPIAHPTPDTVTRPFSLAADADAAAVERLRLHLAAVEGVIGLDLQGGDSRLQVAYDRARLSYGGVAAEIAAAGLPLAASAGTRWRALWYRLLDSVVSSAGEVGPGCCGAPPADGKRPR